VYKPVGDGADGHPLDSIAIRRGVSRELRENVAGDIYESAFVKKLYHKINSIQ